MSHILLFTISSSVLILTRVRQDLFTLSSFECFYILIFEKKGFSILSKLRTNMKYLIATSIFCIASVIAQQVITITPNYDYPDEKAKIFYIRRALILKCDVSIDGVFEIEWWKEGQNVKDIPLLDKRYKINGNEFRIDTSIGDDAGWYECVFPIIGQNASIEAIANVEVRLPKDVYVIEGEILQVVCQVVGTKPIISWIVGNDSYTESRGRILLETGADSVNNSLLKVHNVVMEDRNDYTCIARNRASELLGETQQDTTLVRVRSKYAALWPFLGICVEVVIVCFVIWVCERRRLRRLAEEEEDDYEPPMKNKNQGDIRQRH